jgi:hypothetical protein
MSLFVFSANGSACQICSPFEGEIFSDDGAPGYPSTSEAEAAGAFHDGCHHSWDSVSDPALIAYEDRIIAQGTEWHEIGDPSTQIGPGLWDKYLNSINGHIDSTWLGSIKSYTNSGYQRINAILRGKASGSSRAIAHIDKAMANSALKYNMTFWRGTNSSSLDRDLLQRVLGKTHGLDASDLQKLVGQTFEDKGYFSTSAFRGGAFGSRRYELEVISPKGTRGVWVGPTGQTSNSWGTSLRQGISVHLRETEFIMDRSTEFRILSATKNGNTIHLKVIARQKAIDPAARAAAQKAAAKAAKQAATQAAKPPVMPTVSGPVPSPTSVAKGLEKMNVGAVGSNVEVQAAWVGPDKMAIKLVDKSTGQILKDAVVTVTKNEAKAAKAAGQGVQAAKFTQTPAPAATPSPAAATAAGKVPAAEVKQLLTDLGMTKGQLAKAVGKSPSLITEWTGGGHGNLLAQSQWADVKAKAIAWANSPH